MIKESCDGPQKNNLKDSKLFAMHFLIRCTPSATEFNIEKLKPQCELRHVRVQQIQFPFK